MNKRHAREGEDQELADLQEGGQAKKLKQEDCKCSRARVVRAGLYPSFCCVDCDRNLLTGAEVNDLIAEEYRPDHPLEIKTLAGALAGVIHQSAFAWGYLQVMLKAMAPYMTDSGTWPANKELLDVIYQWLAASQVQAPFLFTEDEFVELLQELETMPNIRAFFPTQSKMRTRSSKDRLPLVLVQHLLFYVLQVVPHNLDWSSSLLGHLHCLVYDATGGCAILVNVPSFVHEIVRKFKAQLTRVDDGKAPAVDGIKVAPALVAHLAVKSGRVRECMLELIPTRALVEVIVAYCW